MPDALRLYLHYAAVSVRSQMQYRASFLMATLGHLVGTGIEFVGLWALFARFGQIEGWRLPEVALFYGLANVAFACADAAARGFDLFGNTVKAGEFDRLLLRPRSTALQLLGQELTLRRIGRLAQGLVVLLWAGAATGVVWTPPRIALALLAMAGSACLFIALVILQATLAFWTTESLEVMNTLTYGGVQATSYPLAIYEEWFRKLFIYIVPLACVNYFPVVAILGRPDPLGTPVWFQCVSPLLGFAFLLVALRVWAYGERHYVSTGS